MYTRRPASLTYEFSDPASDREVTCEIAFTVIEPDTDVGYRGEVCFEGVFVTEIQGVHGPSDGSWWDIADRVAEAYLEGRDDWRDKAWEQWRETE